MTARYTAVLDRIVDGETAVLLLESGEELVAERTLPADELPAEGRAEGTVYDVVLEGEAAGEATETASDSGSTGEANPESAPIATLEPRPAETERRRERSQERFDRLSKRLGEE